MVIGRKPRDIYARGGRPLEGAPLLAYKIVKAAGIAVEAGEFGAENFFFSRFGRNLLLGLGADPEVMVQKLSEDFGMSTRSLDEIARDMKREAMSSPRIQVRRPLKGGLNLTLTYELTHWRLSLTRPKVQPSRAEIATCRRTFRIPETVEIDKHTYRRTDETFYIVRFRWESLVQLSFIDDGSAVTAFADEQKPDTYYSEVSG